ncbi:MAG: acyl carrier protein [Planctomycetes bacterium]|nr:acyl carrier protein [Planctomycetota bacterium]
MELARRIRDFVVTNFLFGDGAGLTASQSLLRTGVIDSTGALELITWLENDFHISVDDAEVVPANLDSLDNIAAFLRRKLAAAAA